VACTINIVKIITREIENGVACTINITMIEINDYIIILQSLFESSIMLPELKRRSWGLFYDHNISIVQDTGRLRHPQNSLGHIHKISSLGNLQMGLIS
jgi:hypothetical protein